MRWHYLFSDRLSPPGRPSYALAPWADGLCAAQVELIALVPGTDINGALWSALVRGADGARIAAVLCVDPFLRVADRCALLRSAGIEEIVNLPTVRLYEAETGRVLEDTGYGWKREIEQLVRFREAGFAVNVVVRDRSGARDALALDPRRLIVHPGLPPADPAARLVAMKRATDLCRSLGGGGTAISLYRPHGYEEETGAARDLAAGRVALQFVRP